MHRHPEASRSPRDLASLVRFLVASFAAFALVAMPATAQAKTTVKLGSVASKQKSTSLVTFSGSAGKKSGAKVVVERQKGRKWTSLAKGRTGKRGKFSLTWISPSKATRLVVRARVGGSVSKTRKFRVLAPAKGAPKIVVSPKTRVISASTVAAVPAPGKAGTLTYAGGNDAAVGQIFVVGQSATTPTGFLGKVTGVSHENGATVVNTVPATIEDALPVGSMNLVTPTATASRAHGYGKSTVTCVGSVGASITQDVSFSTSLALSSDWNISKGGLQSASVTAGASLNATIGAAIAASGSCSLAQTQLLKIKGPSLTAFVGPIPIVLTSDLTVYLDANASASAQFSTSASAGFSASAGVAYQKGVGFSAIKSFTPKLNFSPPTLSAGASAGINVTPTVDVLLYGLAGPRVALRTGVAFNADTTQNPWWTLDVPVDLTASIAIPVLDLESPLLHLYTKSFPLADAGGPFGTTPPAPDAPPTPEAPVTNVATQPTKLAAGFAHSCAIRSSGSVACWGSNANGQLGTGNKTSSPTPVAVKGITDAVAVVAGRSHTCALRVAGQVLCWGLNDAGQVGVAGTADVINPTVVSGVTSAVAIAAGDHYTCAVLGSGKVMCWGANDEGQLGNGGVTAGGPTPVAVTRMTNAVAASANGVHSCVLQSDKTVSCWGRNSSGELGDGTTTESDFPVKVSGLTNATAVATGFAHSCAILTTGGVNCWGGNGSAQLGDNTLKNHGTPAPVSGITNATTIAGGGAHTCVVLTTGVPKCWGSNEYGQVGDGSGRGAVGTPATVAGITNAASVTGGFEHSCSLLTTGAVQCWGYGQDGELGDGTNANRATPVSVVGLP